MKQAQAGHTKLLAGFKVEEWRRGFFEPDDTEQGFYFIEGVDMPADLCGTLFRNGPGKFQAGKDMVTHQLDGDGLVLAISFDPEEKRVCVRHRLVQTQGLLRDRYAKRMFAKGFHGTPPGEGGLGIDPRKSVPKHTANATMMQWEDKLLAVGHFGKPFEIDPACLGTVLGNEDEGSWNIDGALGDAGIGSFPRVCGTEQCLTFITQTPSALSTAVSYVEFAPGAWRPRYPNARKIDVGGYTRFSDFAITPKWFILCKPPLRVDGLGAAFGKTFSEVLDYDPAGTSELIFATRLKRDEAEIVIPVDNLVCEEFVNAYEDGNRVILDMIAADRWDGKATEGRPKWEEADESTWPKLRLVRYEVDLASQTWTKTEGPVQKNLCFTSVNTTMNGKKHRYIFGAVSQADAGPASGVVKVDMETGTVDEWLLEASEFCGEPLFISKEDGEEDGGYLVTVTFNGEKNSSDVVVLDAKSVSQGPICRFSLEKPMPHGRRACWVPQVTFTPDEMKRKTTLMRMFAKKSSEWSAVDLGFSAIGSQALFQKQGTKMR